MYAQSSRWPQALTVLLIAAVVGLGIWAFGVDKPSRTVLVEIGVRHIEGERAELALRETDHEGVVHFYEASGAELDYGLVNRPRSLYSDPVTLSNDRNNAPSRVRITLRGLSDGEVKLGLRVLRPNRTWDSTRFPREEPLLESEWQSGEWFYLSALPVKVVYHQLGVDAARLFIYIAGAFGVVGAIALFVWRRWLS